MPNGKHGDNPLSDMIVHGQHPFPPDIEAMLRKIDRLGRTDYIWPLGQNWSFSPREFDWEEGKDLDGARRDLAHLISMLEANRGEEILIHPQTRQPIKPEKEEPNKPGEGTA